MRTRMAFYYDYGYFALEEYACIVADLPNHDLAYANGLVRAFVAVSYTHLTLPTTPYV